MIDAAYTKFFMWLVARRRAALVVTGLIALVCVLVSSRISLEEDILSTLPENDRLVDEYKYAVRKFRQIDRVFIDVGVATTEDAEKLGRAADELAAALETNAAFARVNYRHELGGQRRILDLLTGSLPNLFTDGDAAELSDKLKPESVREYLATMRRKLAGPEGMVLKDVVAADPVGMSSFVLAKALPLQTGFGDARIEDGRLVSGDGKHVLILAEPRFPPSKSGECEALVMGLLDLARGIEKRHPGVTVAFTGGHRMTLDNATLIKGDATRCIFLGMGAMLVLCLTAYRRRWLALLTFLPSLFGSLVAGAALAIGWDTLSAISLGFATIAIGITVDYAIYVIYHLDDAAGSDRATVGRRVGQLVAPISLGALSTASAFIVMSSSPMRGYQQLGWFGAACVICSVLFALVILPLLIPMTKQSGQQTLWLTRSLDRFHGWRKRNTIWLLPLLVLLTIAAVLGVKRVRFDGDMARMNGITEATRLDEERIRTTWGDAMGMTLVVARAPDADAALELNDRAAAMLATNANVESVFSLSTICPSRATQQANILHWQGFWTQERRDSLRALLETEGTSLGFRADAFVPFWKRIAEPPPILTLDAFRDTPLEQALAERAAIAPGDCAVSTLLKLKDRTKAAELRESLPAVMVLDSKAFVDHIAGLSKKGLIRFAFWTALIVGIIVLLSHASLELALAILLPVALGALWTLGAMGWLGMPVDLMNSVFIIFVIGISEDYSVFFVTAKLDEWQGRPTRIGATSASVTISALTTIFGFAVLVFANHPVLFSMGTTVLIGMVGTFAITLILTPLLMELLLFRDPPRGAPRAWHVLGAVCFGLHMALSQVFLYCIARPFLFLVSRRDATARLRRLTGWFARTAMQNLPYGKLEYQNISPSTFEKPSIVISNHQSAVDVMLIVSLPGDIRQTAKKRIFDTPILGIGAKLLGHVQVEPNDPATTLERCRARIAEGASIHFYPEGTRSPDGFVRRFHRGAFELAVETRQDILPVIICDSWTAMPRDAYWIEPCRVSVRALPRVTPENFDYSLGAVALMRHCETIVRNGLQQSLDAINTPRVVRRKVARLYRYQGKYVEEFVKWKMKLDPMFTHLDSVVPRSGTILDLGCGYGVVTNWLAQYTDTRRFIGLDYDAEKIRIAKRTAPHHDRIEFREADILAADYPPCDTVLLLDVLHYWVPEKQEQILRKARAALRPGGRLILRDGLRAEGAGHARVNRWEKFATRFGLNKTIEGLYFLTQDDLTAMLRRAGFSNCRAVKGGGKDSNALFVIEA